ncbi:unnamed protein product [Protopolystoma xenopodis]|uniref:Uncharacterized protein n=1 Tax=Protopolystoma xenopodis TaxID=117903 RepID=A0A448XHS0_9PLAT|nr:unnamed protein product [Protopolystoma xenopodis]
MTRNRNRNLFTFDGLLENFQSNSVSTSHTPSNMNTSKMLSGPRLPCDFDMRKEHAIKSKEDEAFSKGHQLSSGASVQDIGHETNSSICTASFDLLPFQALPKSRDQVGILKGFFDTLSGKPLAS